MVFRVKFRDSQERGMKACRPQPLLRGWGAQRRGSKEGQRAGSDVLLLRGVWGARSTAPQAPSWGTFCSFYHLLSDLSALNVGLIRMCSFHEYLLTSYSEPKKGSPYLVW